LKHADASLQDLVWQRPNVAPRLMQLLDLRGGDEFLHPTQRSLKASKEGNDDDDDDDDLDSLLASGDLKSKEGGKFSLEELQIPRLLPAEENVIKLVLDILRLLLETDSVRHIVWEQHTGLCNIVWGLALVNPSLDPPVYALPSPSLQQEALNLVADKFNDPITMDNLSGLDRLFFIVCTGGGISDKFDDKLGLSQSALAVLRQSLSGDRIHDILMRTLAPPPTEDENAPPPGPTEIQKLWNTVQENLISEVSERRTLFLSGALGGLGLMLCDEQSREIMSKLAPIGFDQLLESLSEESDGFVQCSLVRFFCEWIYECPFIAHKILSCTASTHLAGMAAAASSYQSLTHLLLGLAMEYSTKEEECGGWTRNGILQIIVKIGISKYTISLEGLKNKTNPKMPWVVSEMEYKNWKKFCDQAVLTVRKRVVEELAGESGESDDESDHNDIATVSDGTSSLSNQGMKPLRKMISQQSREMDGMRKEMDEMRTIITSQDDQLSTWKRRMESTPTELDDMLNEFTSKNVKLGETIKTIELEVERQKSEKETETKLLQNKLSEYRDEAARLHAQEQEVRDDLKRTEQEMQSLSQAYTSLEEDYQRNQNHQDAGAPAGETSQQLQGEVPHQQSGIGSTETATLRAENTRLKNDARAADEWMSMAVQKLSDMGAANVEMEKQFAGLNSQIVESQVVAKKNSAKNENAVHQLRNLESQLNEEKALRVAAEERATSYDNLKIELESEQQKSETLNRRITEGQEALFKFKNMDTQMQNEKKRYTEMELRIFEAEEEIRVTAARLEDERNAKIEIEKQLSAVNLSNGPSNDDPVPSQIASSNDEQAKILRSEYDTIVTTKNAEIEALTLSLQKGHRDEQTVEYEKHTEDAEHEINEIRQSSQEEIYRLESVVRELKEKLGNGLGAYKVEDIRVRDEEIEELRTANESAQQWMEKAVEHHQRNSAQISKLSEEKVAMTLQLEEVQMKVSSQNMNDTSSIQNELIEKSEDFDLMSKKFAKIEVELDELKREKEGNQGLINELGIAMDDVKITKQQLVEYKAIVTDLERKLSGNNLNKENDQLISSNKDLQTRLNEFEEWTQGAQSKIADIMGAKDKAENELLETREELRSLQGKNESLHSNVLQSEDDKCASEKLKEDNATLELTNDSLQEEVNDLERQYRDIQSQYNILLEESHEAEQILNNVTTVRDDIKKNLTGERQLSIARCVEIDDLKATNMDLLSSVKELKKEIDDNRATPSEPLMTESNDILKEESIQTGHVTRINELLKELERTKVELTTANEDLSRDEDVVREWEDRVSQLEFELADVHQQLMEQEAEALDAIAKWQQNNVESEERCAELEQKLKNISNARESTEVINNLPDAEYIQLKELNISLQEKVKELEVSLDKKFDHQVDSKTRDKDTISELEEALKAAQKTLTRDEEVVQQWEERVAELEITVESLQNELREQEDETNDVISQWQDNCTALELRCSTIEEEMKESNRLNQTQYRNMVDTLSEKDKDLLQAHEDAESTEDSMQKLKDEVSSLESRIHEIQNEVQNKEATENVVNLKLKESLDSSEKKCFQLEVDIEEAVATKEEELQELRELLNSNSKSEEQSKAIQALSHQIESTKEQFRSQELQTINTIEQLENSFAASEQENKSLRQNLEETKTNYDELQVLRSTLSDNEKIVLQWEERTDKLSESVTIAQDQLKEQEKEACDAIAQWQETCEQLEEKNVVSEQEITSLKENLERAKTNYDELQIRHDALCSNDDQIIRQWEERTNKLSESIMVLEDQLKEQEQEACDAITQWQTSYSDLEVKCSNMENKVQNSCEAISIRNWSIEQLTSRNANYCTHIKQLKLSSLKVESSAKTDLLDATSAIARFTEAREAERNNRTNEREQLQAEISGEKEKNHEARDEIETLTSSLEEMKLESENTLSRWTARYEELKNAFQEIQQQLEEQEYDANEVISMWESKTEELEKDLGLAEDQLQRLEAILIVNDNDNEDDKYLVDVAENILVEKNDLTCQLRHSKSLADEYDAKAQGLKSENENLVEKLSNSDEQLQAMYIERDRMKHQLSLKSQDKLEEERDRLVGEVGQIEEELREANGMLQACVTDGLTNKATEVAGNALRDEVNNIRNQLIEYQQKYEDESSAREVSDLEITRLRQDIASLLSLSDHENNPTNLKKLTSRSIEKLQNIEHTEIDDLRKSLFRAMEELELIRSIEKDSNETISKLRLHISIYEQEIIAAKTEVNFLSEAMEELRQTEDSKRASLEYRIGSLENENDVVRKYQATELENVRNELAQVSMEKDMIIHNLKETEKTNSSLVLATSNEDSDNLYGRNNIKSEYAKLRVENAHLLTVAADDEGRAERRLRELLSAQIASSELDVILERGLRLSAEATQETLKQELNEVHNDSNRLIDRQSNNGQDKNSNSIIDELNSFRSSLETMKNENARLKDTMREEASKAKNMIDIMTEECRKAQAKACKFDRDTRTELAVQSEIAKMRLPAVPSNGKSCNEDSMHRSKKGPSIESYDISLPSAEVFDLIRKQKEEIQEERMMYCETLQEHEDLLALVAQQDLEKSCLREALIEVAGDKVADEAMKRAEEFAINRYGNAVQVAN